MTIPKFEPVAYVDEDDDNKWATLVDDLDIKLNAPLYTADQLTEAYEAGKRKAIPEGWVLVPKEILDRFPETDPRNYDHDDVCSLNDWGVELVLAAAPKGEE